VAGEDLRNMKKKALYELARKHNVAGRANMSKVELLVALQAAGAAVSPSEPKMPMVPSASGAPVRPEPLERPDVRVAGDFVDWGHPLPLGYGLDRIVALARDPFWVFVYWELHGPGRQALQARSGQTDLAQARWLLQVRNLTNGTSDSVPVSADSYNWYLRVADGCDYEIDLGVLATDGTFVAGVTSNRVSTPSSTLSKDVDTDWIVVEEGQRRVVDPTREVLPEWVASRKLAVDLVDDMADSAVQSARPPREEPS